MRRGDGPAVDHRGGPVGAEPEAIDRLDRHRAACAGAVPFGAEPPSTASASAAPPTAWQASARQIFTTWRPAGTVAEIVVEAHHPMHLGPADVERLGDHRHGGIGHMTEGRLQRVQDRQERPFAVQLGSDQLGDGARWLRRLAMRSPRGWVAGGAVTDSKSISYFR